jgi:3-phytase
LRDLGSVRVFEAETGRRAAPMGIALYKRGSDGALFAVVGRKSGPAQGYLWQYRVEPGPSLKLVRKFGRFSGDGEIESIVVDDTLGYTYYSDEGAGVRKYHADPDAAGAAKELALFGTSGYRGDREGERTGFVVSTDQIPGGSRYLLYRREGAAGNPHDHDEVAGIIEGGADATDGIEICSAPLGPRFPLGLLVAMNSGSKNFLYYGWKARPRSGDVR